MAINSVFLLQGIKRSADWVPIRSMASTFDNVCSKCKKVPSVFSEPLVYEALYEVITVRFLEKASISSQTYIENFVKMKFALCSVSLLCILFRG